MLRTYYFSAEPSWDIHVSYTGESSISERVVREKVSGSSAQSLKCYVCMKTGDTVKSSEIYHLNYDYLAHMNYQPLMGSLSINDNHYNLSIFGEDTNRINIESLTAKFYHGENLIAEKSLEVQEEPQGIKHYNLSYESGSEDISNIILKVKYENGDTFQREIY